MLTNRPASWHRTAVAASPCDRKNDAKGRAIPQATAAASNQGRRAIDPGYRCSKRSESRRRPITYTTARPAQARQDVDGQRPPDFLARGRPVLPGRDDEERRLERVRDEPECLGESVSQRIRPDLARAPERGKQEDVRSAVQGKRGVGEGGRPGVTDGLGRKGACRLPVGPRPGQPGHHDGNQSVDGEPAPEDPYETVGSAEARDENEGRAGPAQPEGRRIEAVPPVRDEGRREGVGNQGKRQGSEAEKQQRGLDFREERRRRAGTPETARPMTTADAPAASVYSQPKRGPRTPRAWK